MQVAYIGRLMELAEQDNRIVYILADSGTTLDVMFKRNFPDRMINFGISESSAVSAAAGMASVGKIPFVFAQGAFLTYRAFEFIRDDVCFQNKNVKIIGQGSGLSLSSLGYTHHTTEDVALLNTLPNLTILSPATPIQTAECIRLAYENEGPVYVRIGMNGENEYYDDSYRINTSNEYVCKYGRDAVILTSGSIMSEVEKASRRLKDVGVNVTVVNVIKIKPFDMESIVNLSNEFDQFITVEEHSIHGGLGSIISECIAENCLGARLLRIGLDGVAKGYGTQADIRKRNGLDADTIVGRIKDVIR